jgi:signal transduction histidine kinase
LLPEVIMNLSPEQLQILIEAQSGWNGPTGGEESLLLPLLAQMDRELTRGLWVEQHCAAGEILFAEDDAGNAMYLIRSGVVAILKGSLDAPVVLGFRGPGEMIGEMALLENLPRSATVAALRETRLLRIEQDKFRQLLSDHPPLSFKVMAALSARLRSSDEARLDSSRRGRRLVQKMDALQSENQQLQELQRVRSETSDLVVHDLRNPLNTIYLSLCTLELVLPPADLESNQELIDISKSAAERMKRLVNSLLDISRLEGNQDVLQRVVVTLPDLVEAIVSQMRVTYRAARVELRVDLPADLPAVLIDEEKIGRVLANLLDNAIKYTPPEGQVTISARCQDHFVAVMVTDTGLGIPAGERQRVFERFAQVPGESQKRRGFGLGLTFCRLTVEAHGGTIHVEAGPHDVGSRFIFTLPVA